MERRHSPHRNEDSYHRYSPDDCFSHCHRRDDGGAADAATGKCISSSWTDRGHVTNERDDSTNSGRYHHHHHHHHGERDDYGRRHYDEQLPDKSRNRASPPLPSLSTALRHHGHHRHDDGEATRRMLRFHPPKRKEEGSSKFTPTSTFTFTTRSAVRMKREEDEAIIRSERSHHGNHDGGPENQTRFSEASTVIVANDGNAAKAAFNEKHSLLAENDMNTDVLHSPKGGNDCNRNEHTHNVTNPQPQPQQKGHGDAAPAHVNNTIASGSATSGNMRENNNKHCSIVPTVAVISSPCQQRRQQPQPEPQQHSKDVIFSRRPTIIHPNRPRDSLKQSTGKECSSSNHDHFPLHEHPAPSSISISNPNPTCDETGNSTRGNKSYFRSNNNHNHNNNNRNIINTIRNTKKKYDINNLMKLPSHHASSSAKFPPGCPVVYHYRVPHSCSDYRPDTTRDNLIQNGNTAITADTHNIGNNGDYNHVRIHVGKVQSVYIDFSSASRELVHAISTKKGKGTNIEDEGEELLLIDENSLAYAPQCPIVFHPASASGRDAEPPNVIGDDGASVGNALGDGAGDGVDAIGMEGIVLLCRPQVHSSGTNSGDYGVDGSFVYTILLHVPHDEGLLIKENVEIENISYRPKHDDDMADVDDRKCIAMMGYNGKASTKSTQPIGSSGNLLHPDGGEHRSRQAGGLKQIDVNTFRNGSSNWRAQTTASGTVPTRRNDDTIQSTTEKRFFRGEVDTPATSDYCTKEDDRTKENQMPSSTDGLGEK